MGKHTPGPWWATIGEQQPVCYYRGLVCYVAGADHLDRSIAVVTGEHGDTSGRTSWAEEWEHNARLISAAPDLLEALGLILPLAKGYAAQNRVGSNQEYIETAEAAIAKATGEDT